MEGNWGSITPRASLKGGTGERMAQPGDVNPSGSTEPVLGGLGPGPCAVDRGVLQTPDEMLLTLTREGRVKGNPNQLSWLGRLGPLAWRKVCIHSFIQAFNKHLLNTQTRRNTAQGSFRNVDAAEFMAKEERSEHLHFPHRPQSPHCHYTWQQRKLRLWEGRRLPESQGKQLRPLDSQGTCIPLTKLWHDWA